jgi:hypothetical protein
MDDENPNLPSDSSKHNMHCSFSSLTQNDIDEFVKRYGIPSKLNPVMPKANQPIYNFPEGKIGVYNEFFKTGNYLVPFTRFLIKIFMYNDIHLSHMSPQSFSRLSHFEITCRAFDTVPDLFVFWAFYPLTMADDRYTFEKRRQKPSLCTKTPPHVRTWKTNFFYIDDRCVPI